MARSFFQDWKTGEEDIPHDPAGTDGEERSRWVETLRSVPEHAVEKALEHAMGC
jgi:hypothetical protein